MPETTPYGVRETSDGWEVWHEWWNRKVGGPFATREEAEDDALAAKRESRRGTSGRPRPDFDPRVDYPERYTDGRPV